MDYSDNRRDFLKTLGVGAIASTVAFKAPYVFAKNTPTIRVMGTHVTLQEDLRQKAMLELGINIEFTPMGSAAVLQKAASDPSSFDLYEQWSDCICFACTYLSHQFHRRHNRPLSLTFLGVLLTQSG